MADKASIQAERHGLTMKSYATGFILSILLTLVAYIMVKMHLDGSGLGRKAVIGGVVGLAFAQFLVQLLFFLHMGRETRPRWKLMTFLGAVLVVLILVVGSIWIMYNLNYHMTTKQVNDYMQSQDSL